MPILPNIYWIPDIEPYRLAMAPHPRGNDLLEEEILAWRDLGVNVVVSLLEREEILMLGMEKEAKICEAFHLQYVSFPIPDRGVPHDVAQTEVFINQIVPKVLQGYGVGIHCRAGIGRSGIVSACVLMKLGIPPQQVFSLLTRTRGIKVPDTAGQEEWVYQFAANTME